VYGKIAAVTTISLVAAVAAMFDVHRADADLAARAF